VVGQLNGHTNTPPTKSVAVVTKMWVLDTKLAINRLAHALGEHQSL